MRTSSILAVVGFTRFCTAFTNGTLIPAYFCNPVADGMPKSLGELIPFLEKEQAAPLAFNPTAGDNLQTVPQNGNSTKPGNAGYMLASFHNSINTIVPINPGIKVSLANNATSMVAGKANSLVLDSGNVNIALDGALMYGLNSTGARAGSFTDAGTIFKDFAGCGVNPQGQISGVVHSGLISCTNNYTQLSYNAPLCGDGIAILKGLSVTDAGFGVWNYTFPVTGQLPLGSAGCPVAQVLEIVYVEAV